MRQELFSSSSLQDDDDVDSDNHDGATAKFLFMFGCIALVAYITSWHRKQNQLRKSGYHKKVDERG
jgi:adenylylsulfate kinase-like enzyme